MMTCFYQASSLWQIVLLVISQLAVIFFAVSVILLAMRHCRWPKIIGMAFLLLLNSALYVVIQLDSRITGAEQGLHLHVPYLLLLAVVLVSMGFGFWAVMGETMNRKILGHTSIKESFDHLPSGVCFFNEAGLPILCNPSMQRFSFAVCGKDVQLIGDLEECLCEDFVPVGNVSKDGKVFVLSDGRAWQLDKRAFLHESGHRYMQFVASDVTDVYRSRVTLQHETEQLRQVQEDLKRLSANVVAVTREEEILNAKMRVHDEMGRCLVAAQKYLASDSTDPIPDSVTTSWQRAVSMLKYNNETVEEDMLLQIRKTCESVGLTFVQTGHLPTDETAAYILTCAVRECVTNAVRYADATELYATFSETDIQTCVVVSNNGKAPDGEIQEGGGLSTLRRRVERAGGVMMVDSTPIFKLTVTVPKTKEGVI